ncbi:MAG: ABC transporter permease subunit [Bacteroidia bacterium]|nr:ABC transporter permease subunit [Bacteroidia bacterium]
MILFAIILAISTARLVGGPLEKFQYPGHLAPGSFDGEGNFFPLGTSMDGKDMLEAILYGAGYSIWLGLLTSIFIGILGMSVGVFLGYQGQKQLDFGLFGLISWVIGLVLGWFYGFGLRKYIIREAAEEGILYGLLETFWGLVILVLLVFLFSKLGKWLDQRFKSSFRIKVGEGIIWLLQLLDSLPSIILILSLMAIFRERSLILVMSLLALTSWSQLALLTRGMVLKEIQLPYIEAAKMLGMRDIRIILNHILPNIISAVAVVMALLIGRIIIMESALGFLELIEGHDGIGGMLSVARKHSFYPWLGQYPGLMLAIILILIYLIGESFKVFGEGK